MRYELLPNYVPLSRLPLKVGVMSPSSYASAAHGIDGLTKECISYCHPSVLVHLKLLFNIFCSWWFWYTIGIVIPVVKDRLGDLCSADNYRPITLKPSYVVSKIFE